MTIVEIFPNRHKGASVLGLEGADNRRIELWDSGLGFDLASYSGAGPYRRGRLCNLGLSLPSEI